jgi:hypothetical protein
VSDTIVSVMFTGDGSVEVSARPTLATTEATSGNCAMAAFCFLVMSMAWASEMAGSVTGMNIRSPSLRGGINSLPMEGTRRRALTKTSTAPPSVKARCVSAQRSIGR